MEIVFLIVQTIIATIIVNENVSLILNELLKIDGMWSFNI